MKGDSRGRKRGRLKSVERDSRDTKTNSSAPPPYRSSRQTPDFSSGPISQGFLHTHKRSRRRTASITHNHWCPVSPLLLGMNKTNISFAANSISSAPITRHAGGRTAMGRAEQSVAPACIGIRMHGRESGSEFEARNWPISRRARFLNLF